MQGLPRSDSNSPAAARDADCPTCQTRMVVQRIVAGHRGTEHWTFRCARCGQIHQAEVGTASS